MARISWERVAAVAGVAFVALYVVAFALGIEVGKSDQEILDYYGDSGHRAKEVVAFFCIAGAALALILFATALRSLIARAEQERAMLAALAWAGGITCTALILAGNALSRATAFAAMDDEFQLEPNTRRLFESAGFLLFASGTIAAILLVVAVSLAALRHAVVPLAGLGRIRGRGAAATGDRIRRVRDLRGLGARGRPRARATRAFVSAAEVGV